MHENSGNSVIYYAHYTEGGVNKTGLTVTITVYEVIRDGTKTKVVTDGACTEIGDGLYRYLLASGTVDAAAEYVAVFHTATDTVDAQDIPAMWVIDRAGTEKLDTGITLADDAITAASLKADAVTKIQTGLALEATLTAIKGAGWSTQTLSEIVTAIYNVNTLINQLRTQDDYNLKDILIAIAGIQAGSGATAQEVWEYATRVLTAGTNLPTANDISNAVWTNGDVYGAGEKGFQLETLFNDLINGGRLDLLVDAIKAKTDNIPASPAAVGSAMTLTAAYDKAKDDVLTPLGVVDGIVDAIKVQTDKIPATPASAGEYTANIGAIKAKTDNLPLSPASSGEYTSALTAIQNDLDNPNQYKADVSGLATSAELAQTEADIIAAMPDETVIPDGIALEASVQAIKAKTDNIPATPASAGEYTSALTAIQNDLDNPDQYKADVSGLATTTDMSDLKDRIDAVDTIADAILEDTGTTIPAALATIAGYTDGIAGDVWSYAKRTLTHPSVSAEEPEDSNTLILYRDADIAIELTDLTIPAGAKKYIFTIKDNLDGGDDQAVLQASYAIDGSEVETNTLVYINSAVPPALTNPVTFTLTETNITIDLTAEAAALLPRYERGYLNWDLKLVTDAAVTIVLQGLAQIIGTSTRAIE